MSAVVTAASVVPKPSPSKRGDSLGGCLEKAPPEESASQLSVKKSNKGQRTTTRRRKRAQLEPGQAAPQERARSAQPSASHKSSASGCHQLAVKPSAKTTRVRINSTSEQIEDPNWLQHRLQLEQQQQQQKLTDHLRQLQHKFKMTITGQHSSDDASLRPESAPQPPSLPMIPAKAPVSILKQRSRSPATSETPGHVETGASGSMGGTRHRTTNSHHPPKSNPAQQKATGVSATQSSNNNPPTTTTTHTTAPPAIATTTPPSTLNSKEPKIVPLCAEGQLKVSGWRRKNLLAKTLGHLDEIRGNQMPVFVPTKIRFPSDSSNTSSGSKFVDVVRQAMATRRTSSTPAGALTSDLPSHTPSQLACASTSRVSSSLSTAEDVTLTKRASVSELRANSADHNHQLPHHQSTRHQPINQQRSSSAGLNQQTTGSLTSPKQQVTPTTSQTTTFRTSRPQHLVVDNSARLYKLAHKNQQLLHNLRRQSNEHQPSAVASLINASRTGNVPDDRPTAHLKDWKRLASKLALLTTSGKAGKSSLSVESGQLLRVSISNDEASSGASSSSTNRALSDRSLLLAVPSACDSSGPRKLSSSSMFTQRTSSEAPPGQRLSSDSSGQLTPATTTTVQREVPRRSSDSEAYKRSSLREYLRPEAPKINNKDEELVSDEQEQPVVVVRGDDLLQLLQVASTGSSSDVNIGEIARRSLQLEERPQVISAETRRKNSTHSMDGLMFEDKEEEVQEQRVPLVPLIETNSAEQPSKQPSRRARRDQLSSLVKKTTKVVFLQEKLRKIRWRQSNRGTSSTSNTPSLGSSGLKPSDESMGKVDEIANSDSTEHRLKIGQHTSRGSKEDSAEVLMDPTLIGDAIEIFLRSSMQSRRTTDKEDEADAPVKATLGQ